MTPEVEMDRQLLALMKVRVKEKRNEHYDQEFVIFSVERGLCPMKYYCFNDDIGGEWFEEKQLKII